MGWPLLEPAEGRRGGGRDADPGQARNETNRHTVSHHASTESESGENVADEAFLKEMAEVLRDQRSGWVRRLEAIQSDRRRTSAPLEPDFAEQATQRENDATLDSLDERGRGEIAAIDRALGRIEQGAFGTCLGCGGLISTKRLRAYPTADRCVACPDSDDRG